MAIYGYTRVSTDRQAEEGESLETQQRQLLGWCMMQGRELGETFVERGISGSVPIKARPAAADMWSRLKKGDTIVATKLDRMFRSALDALQVTEELASMGVTLHLLDIGEVTNGLSKLFLTITAAFAEAERDRIRDRIRTAKQDQRQRGRYLGGIVPYGFRVEKGDLVPVPEAQPVIEAIQSLKRDGRSLRAIRAAIADKFDQSLSLATISRIAQNEVEATA